MLGTLRIRQKAQQKCTLLLSLMDYNNINLISDSDSLFTMQITSIVLFLFPCFFNFYEFILSLIPDGTNIDLCLFVLSINNSHIIFLYKNNTCQVSNACHCFTIYFTLLLKRLDQCCHVRVLLGQQECIQYSPGGRVFLTFSLGLPFNLL